MKITPYLLAACLISTSLGSACSSTPDTPTESTVTQKESQKPQQSAQELFLQANQKLDQEEFEKAIALYDRALQVDPKRWDASMNKGIAYSSLQKFNEAVNAMDTALTNGGDTHPEVYYNLGNIYQNRGLYAQSIKAYRAGLALRERPHIDSVMNIAAALMFMRETDQAEQTYEYLKTLAPDDARIYLGLGLLEQMRDHYKAAIEHYDHAILINPEFAQAYYNKGSLQRLAKKYPEALTSFERYLEVAPNGPYAKSAKIRIKSIKSKL